MKKTNAVLIPVHDSVWCLADCLESISKQTKKPDQVMLGIDCCPESLSKAVELKGRFDSGDKRKRGSLSISIHYFPQHSFPYRIRNTLAAICTCDIIHLFDADDIMYPEHLELMGKALTPERYMVACAQMQQEGSDKLEEWERAHGIVSIYRSTFLKQGGFEPWNCAADTEAQHRWQAHGLLKCKPKVPTMLVRKHKKGLTSMDSTGYQSELRAGYKGEIKARISAGVPYVLASLGVSPCVPVYTGANLIDVITAQSIALPLDDVRAGMTPDDELTPEEQTELQAAYTQALAALRYYMKAYPKGYTKMQKAAWKLAQEALR